MRVGKWEVLAILTCLLSIGVFTFLRSEEKRIPSASRIDYKATGWFRECAQWDTLGQRFLVSQFEGGLGEVRMEKGADGVFVEKVLVRDGELKGNSTLGFKLDNERQRVVAVVADVLGNRFSALVAYDLKTWERIFFVKLAGSEKISFADDVALDFEGNAYVTDAKASLIWKVSPDGTQVSVLTASPIFKSHPNKLPFDLVGLNGIVFHPDGYLLVGHTWSGAIFKVSLDGKSVTKVEGDVVPMADGLVLVTPEKLAVAGSPPGVRLLESRDGWKTAHITHRYRGPLHRIATGVTVRDGIVYVNYVNGMGFPRYLSTIGEAVFEPLNPSS